LRWQRSKAAGAPPGFHKKLRQFERIIGYRFRDRELLLNALKHRSYLDISGETRLKSNERLEFLGDSVLSLVVSDHFYRSKERGAEGTLTSLKSTIVSGPVLAEQARKIRLGDFLLLSENEARSGGRDRDSILEDTFEALIGAIYIDRGLKQARRFIRRFVLIDTRDILDESSHQNYKSLLQELVQARGEEPPVYIVIEETGPDHDKRYMVEARLDREVLGRGSGRTKKDAEQQAAKEGIKNYQIAAN
jgi:ribonuclease-3